MSAQPSRAAGFWGRHQPSSRPAVGGPAMLEELEPRLLMSVVGTASSKAMTWVLMMTAWKDSGVLDGTIHTLALIAGDEHSRQCHVLEFAQVGELVVDG